MKTKLIELTIKETEDKIKELKIELLKQPTKRKAIKKEIARLFTFKNRKVGDKKQ